MLRPATATASAARFAADLAIAGLGLAVAWLIAAQTLATRSADPRRAEAMARLREDPLDIPALRTFGLALARDGRPAQAEKVLEFVARRTWRDGPTEVWLFRRRLEQGRFDEAFASADALLRRDADGTTRPRLFAVLSAAAAYVEARPALEARLSASPWWRTDFLNYLGAHAEPAGAAEVLSSLASGATPPTPTEYAPFIERLVGAGDYGTALAAWRRIAGTSRPTGGMLRDGDFSGGADHTPFTWSEASGVGGGSQIEAAAEGRAGSLLRVEYDGFSWPNLPAQLMVLEPGRYEVSWRERTESGAPQRLLWRVRCAETGTVLAATGSQAGSASYPASWREARLDFAVPPSGCRGQWLELIASPGERREPVTARYGGFKVRGAPNT